LRSFRAVSVPLSVIAAVVVTTPFVTAAVIDPVPVITGAVVISESVIVAAVVIHICGSARSAGIRLTTVGITRLVPVKVMRPSVVAASVFV
jgi:hypothetical protein